jgi:histidine decarboxylase
MKLEDVVNGAVGPFENHADGYGNSGASGLGYVSVLKLQTGKVKADMDETLEGIVSYDRAETHGTYVGQINMIAASSFNGINGAVWGYHLSKHEDIADGSIKPLFTKKRNDGVDVPVYSVEPLLNAGERLFGTNDERRYPILPGAHTICAVKSATTHGPTAVWCAIAIAIAEDREKDSNLFIEDAGSSIPGDDDESRTIFLNNLMQKIATSIVRCGDDSNVKYKEIFLGYRTEWIPEGYVGCSLTCAPYVVLAQNAIPKGQKPSSMLDMSIADWENAQGFENKK